MQYDVKSPGEYLKVLEDDWRKDTLLELRQILKDKAPELNEGIDYKMLSYRDANDIIFCLNAQQAYVSLYIGDASKVDPTGELLTGLNLGKGCIRFKKTNVVENTRIEEFIIRSMELLNAGEDIGC